jgi:hypothetical protein
MRALMRRSRQTAPLYGRLRPVAAIAFATNAFLASSSLERVRITSRVPRDGRTPGITSPSKVNDL